MAYVESSRNCNFRCSFCTLTGQGRGYMKQSLDYLRRQIVAHGPAGAAALVDNQFHGADRQFFLDRLGLLSELRRAGHFRYWRGFATDAFFWQDADIALARESGCISMLVGVESFDEAWLQRVNKTQNNRYPQVALIEKCLDAGILFQYGLVFDPTRADGSPTCIATSPCSRHAGGAAAELHLRGDSLSRARRSFATATRKGLLLPGIEGPRSGGLDAVDAADRRDRRGGAFSHDREELRRLPGRATSATSCGFSGATASR